MRGTGFVMIDTGSLAQIAATVTGAASAAGFELRSAANEQAPGLTVFEMGGPNGARARIRVRAEGWRFEAWDETGRRPALGAPPPHMSGRLPVLPKGTASRRHGQSRRAARARQA